MTIKPTQPSDEWQRRNFAVLVCLAERGESDRAAIMTATQFDITVTND